MSNDIPDRIQAEETLQQAKQVSDSSATQYEQMLSMISEIVWRYDVNAKGERIDSYISPVADRMLGLPRGTIGNSFDRFFSYIHPDDLPTVRETLLEAIGTLAKDAIKEYRLQKADGTTLWVRSKGSAYVQPDGQVTVFGTTSDFNERKRGEEALSTQHNLGLNLSTCQSLDQALLYILDSALTCEGLDSGGIYVVDPISGALDLTVHRGLSPQFIERISHYDSDAPQAQRSTTGNPFYGRYSDIRQSGRDEIRDREGLTAMASIPVLYNGDLIAVLNMATHMNDDIPIQTRQMLETIAAQIGSVLVRIRFEQALRESEEKYRNVVERATDGITIIQDGVVRFANRRLPEMWSGTIEEVLGKPFTDYVHPDDALKVADRYRRRIAGEDVPSIYEVALRRRDGSKSYAELNADLITFQGKPADLVIVRDINERKRMEEALRRSEQEKAAVMDSLTNIAVEYLDPQMRIIWVNMAVQKHLGLSMEEIKGDYCYKILQGIEVPCPGCTVGIACKTGQPQGGELVTPDGKTWISRSNPITDADGLVTGIVNVAMNITEHKLAEEALQKARDKLELRVKERTEELERKAAEMERFIYTVSHDLRSPLITIGGFLGFLKNDLGDMDAERTNADLRMIEDAVTRMDLLLGDTLELSRIGRIVNPPEDVPFGEILKEALEQTAENLRSKTVIVSLAQEMPVVRVDRLRVEEVLVNLIENSVRYMGDQLQPLIDVGYKFEGNETVFFVRDNGIGIDPSQHEKVFGLFYKIDPKSPGTGAGLAIVKRIIEVHDGRVWIESELGKGCTIYFTLPLANPK